MSIAQDTQAMQAKLAGNTQALQAMAAQGNMAALLALKEMLESRQYAQSMQANSQMQAPAQPPVLEQMASGLQGPQRGFVGGGTADVALEDVTSGEGGISNYNPIAHWLREKLYGGKTREQYYGEEPPVRDVYPERAGLLHPPKGKVSTLPAPKPAGLAAAVGARAAPTPKAPAPEAAPAPAAEAAPVTAVPLPAPDASAADLAAYQAELKAFAQERAGLSARQRKILDDQYARQAKSMTPDKGQQFWDFLANVGAVGGKNALRAIAKGAITTRDAEVKRKAGLEALKASHEKEMLLLEQAEIAAKEGDTTRAFQLRQEADKVKLEREKTRSLIKENESQGKLRDVQAREADARIPLLKAQTASELAKQRGEGYWKPRPVRTGGGGVKEITPAQRVSWIAAEKARLRKATPDPDATDASLEAQATANVNKRIAAVTGTPAGGPAAAGNRIKFDDL